MESYAGTKCYSQFSCVQCTKCWLGRQVKLYLFGKCEFMKANSCGIVIIKEKQKQS